MSVNTDVLHELGVDYITCVAKEAGGWHQLKSTAFELLRVEEKKGNKVSGFGMAGNTFGAPKFTSPTANQHG